MSLENIKQPPQCIDSEKGILCGVLLDNKFINKYALDSDVFSSREHRLIWKAMNELSKDRLPIDVVTLKDKLGDMVEEEYLWELSSFLLSTSGMEGYHTILIEKWKQRETIKLGQTINSKGYDGKDVTLDIKRLSKVISSYDGQIRTYDDQLTEVLEHVISDEPIESISTGYPKLDKLIGGFEPGQLIVIAGRASMGKTAFMLNLANNMTMEGKKVGYISLEMGSKDLLLRILSMESSVPFGKIKYKNTDDSDKLLIGDAVEKIRPRQFKLYDDMSKTYESIAATIKQETLDNNLDVVFIDYLQLLGDDNNRVQVISGISRGFKLLAGECNIPIVVGSQLSRAVENRMDKQPQLSDLRESGSIEQDADAVLMLYRESYYDEYSDRKNIADILVRKNRNGPCKGMELEWVGPTMQFINKE